MTFRKLTHKQRRVAATIYKLSGACAATRYICNCVTFWRPAGNYEWVIAYWNGAFEWYHIPDGDYGTVLQSYHLDYYIRHNILTT